MFLKSVTESRGSLAGRLALWFGVSTFLLLVAVEALLFWAMRTSLNQDDDQDMAERAALVRQFLADRPQDTEMLQSLAQWKTPETFFEPIFIRVMDVTGHVIAETPGMAELPVKMFPDTGTVGFERRTPSGRPFRVMATQSFRGYRIQVAIDYGGEEKLLAHYRRQLALVSAGGLAACAAMGYWLARRGIRPVQQMAGAIQNIHSATQPERINTGRLPRELATLGSTFNSMLDRLSESYTRLSQFSEDIAHELRTPLNNLSGEAEVALSRQRTEAEYRDVISSSLEECQRLSRLVDRLLFLGRAENPRMQIQRERLIVARELETLREFYEASATEAGVSLESDAPAGITAELDRTLFQHAVGNLIDNALTCTGRGGSVRLAARQENGTLEVEVADTGCGIAAEEIPQLFDRFYRVDAARARDSGGHGLGLTIVRTIVTLHGGRVDVSSQVGTGTRVTLQFPHTCG